MMMMMQVIFIVWICLTALSLISSTSTCRSNQFQLYLLRGHENMKCLDGSPPGYYFRKGSDEGINKWMIHFEGGGWSYTLESSLERSYTGLGSSRSYVDCMDESNFQNYLSSEHKFNPLAYNWNIVYVKYCDSSSYAGDAVANYQNTTLYFYGKENRDGTIRHLLYEQQMKTASEIVIGGCSAGGLAIYLGLDHMRNIIHTINPNIAISGLIDSAFFLDYSSIVRPHKAHIYTHDAIYNHKLDYSQAMRSIYHLYNISAGTNNDCIQHYISLSTRHHRHHHSSRQLNVNDVDTSSCIFAEHLASHIATPFFTVQPKYDSWQIWHVLGTDYRELVNEFGANITNLVKNSIIQSKPYHGVYLDSCTHHCMFCHTIAPEDIWTGRHVQTTVGKLTIREAYSQWYTHMLTYNQHDMTNIIGAPVISKPYMHPHIGNYTFTRLYVQEGKFLCHSCCTCRLK